MARHTLVYRETWVDRRAVEVSFRRPQSYFVHSSWNAPMASNLCPEQAERVIVAAEILLWGCPGKSFRASLPFDEMRQEFAVF